MTILKIIRRAIEAWNAEYQYTLIELIYFLFKGRKK